MPRSRFGELIERPAQRFGLTLGAGLTERLVEDTRYDDALPLLAFTLERFFAKSHEDGVLTVEKYRDLFPTVQVRNKDGSTTEYCGVTVAIKQAAEEILDQAGYAGLPADDLRWHDLRCSFYSLVQIGEADQFTRRRALWSQMPDSTVPVLNLFVEQRLLVSSAEDGKRTLSVAHEALFRVWDKLHYWLLQDRKALALRTQIEEAAAEWDAAQRIKSRQWQEDRILDAVGEIGRSGVSLGDVAHPESVQAFLGPTDPEALAQMPALGADQNEIWGSGKFGDAWCLPLNHEARASAGVRLALLGDRRRDVGLRQDGLPEIGWCDVPGGKIAFEIQLSRLSSSKVDAPFIPEWLQNKFMDSFIGAINRSNCFSKHISAFRIARYPVTVAQYRAFLEAGDGWRDPRWWTDDLYRDSEGNSYDIGRYGNHPAVNVNWFDAIAFCRWLSWRLGLSLCLPSEWQWQQAATGANPANSYPWGLTWEPKQGPLRANTFESELRAVTAVGMYPAGTSPAGMLDAVGTVEEWCLNKFDDPNIIKSHSNDFDFRVLRGGSWYDNQVSACCAFRHSQTPKSRLNFVGFRVLCTSPIVEIID